LLAILGGALWGKGLRRNWIREGRQRAKPLAIRGFGIQTPEAAPPSRRYDDVVPGHPSRYRSGMARLDRVNRSIDGMDRKPCVGGTRVTVGTKDSYGVSDGT